VDKYSQLVQELEQVPHVQGIVPSDLVALPANIGALLRNMMRQGPLTASALAFQLKVTVEQANYLGNQLIAKGYLLSDPTDAEGGYLYRVFYARMRKQNMPSQLL
jgi:hypothetical protein